MGRAFNQGYNAALRDIRQNIARTLAAGKMTAEQRDALACVPALCCSMRQRTSYKPRLAAFAARYAVSLRTVKNWKRAGCPFYRGHATTLEWMFRRRTLPTGPKRKFAREFAEMSFADAARAAREAGRGVTTESDIISRYMLSLRISDTMSAAEMLGSDSLLRRATTMCALAKAAVRAGLW